MKESKIDYTKRIQGYCAGKEQYVLAFGLGFFALLFVLLPCMLLDGGYFTYYGDFNSQQIPFYELANNAVRSGGLWGWNWYTDLGSSFIGSYAFYLLGSPFFWLSTLLPEDWVLYSMGWLLCLKHGVASLTAYAYIRRFVQNKRLAVIGGLLYTFSGFQLFNLFFNHFQDVTALFPLLLIALEEHVNNNRRGVFALAVACMALVNYFFFIGQVTFLLLYFLVRLGCKDFHMTGKKFLALIIESVLGVGIACFLFLPAIVAVLQNSRLDDTLIGQGMVLYADKTRLIRIVQSFFMIPDVPARPNLFSTNNGKWASIGGYLPLFSMAGVIAFMGKRKKHWASKIIWLSIIFAFVPILNASFYMFNASYYARWYYMPILIMAMMTVRALDDVEISWKHGMTASMATLLVFGVIAMLPTEDEDGETVFFTFANYPWYFALVLAITILGLLGCRLVLRQRARGDHRFGSALALTVLACIVCTMSVVYFGKADTSSYISRGIEHEDLTISYESDEADYFRVDISDNYDNYPMLWGLSSMRCFQSTVSGSIMDFYDSIGITRDVSSEASQDCYTLRGLFSVKYYFRDPNSDEVNMPGFSYYGEENGFEIYVNDYFIPMGFTFDYYVTDEDLQGRTDSAKEKVLIRALVLDEEQIETYGAYITQLNSDSTFSLSQEAYLAECKLHQEECCEDFVYDAYGFSAKITLSTSKLVFFSIPYDEGWTATVNGEEVTVENVDHGLIAILCGKGENEIVFSYSTPGLQTGMYLSLASVLLLLVYIGTAEPLFQDSYTPQRGEYDYVPTTPIRAEERYIKGLLAKGETQNETSSRRKTSGRDIV